MIKYQRNDVFYPKTETRLSPKEMLLLKNRYDSFDANVELKNVSKHVFNSDIKSYQKIVAWGLDHLLFIIKLENNKEYVVRLNNTSVGDDYFEIEKLVYEKLYEKNIQKCKVYHLERREDGNFPYDFIILTNIKDGDLEKLLVEDPEVKVNEKKLLVESGKLLKNIHSIETKGFGFFNFESALVGKLEGEKSEWKDYFLTAMDNNLKSSYELGFVKKHTISKTEKVIRKYDHLLNNIKPVLLHGDFCDHNIMVTRNRVSAVIDLTDTMSGDYLHDIAFWLSFYDFDRLNYLLKGYFLSEERSVDHRELVTKLYYYLLRINYSKAILRYRYGIPEKVELAINKIEESLNYLDD